MIREEYWYGTQAEAEEAQRKYKRDWFGYTPLTTVWQDRDGNWVLSCKRWTSCD